MVQLWFFNFYVWLSWILSVHIYIHVFLEEIMELRQVLATKHISGSEHFTSPRFSIILKARIAEAPSLQLKVIHLDLLRWVVVDRFGVSLAVHFNCFR